MKHWVVERSTSLSSPLLIPQNWYLDIAIATTCTMWCEFCDSGLLLESKTARCRLFRFFRNPVLFLARLGLRRFLILLVISLLVSSLTAIILCIACAEPSKKTKGPGWILMNALEVVD